MAKLQSFTGEYLEETLEELLEEVCECISYTYPESQIILYGPFAIGEFDQDSYINFCVLVPDIFGSRIRMNTNIGCFFPDDFPINYSTITFTFDEYERKSQDKKKLHYRIKKEGKVLLG